MVIGIDASRGNTRQRTGVEEYVFQIVHALQHKSMTAQYAHVRFVLYTREPLIPELAQLPENVESHVLRWPPQRLWTQLRLSWEMLVRPPDVLFVPGHVVPLIHPKKTVMTVHDVAATSFPESFNRFERWYSLWAARYALRHVWKSIVPSDVTKDELQKLHMRHLKSAPVYTIPLGYSTSYRVIDDTTKIDSVLNTYGIRRPFLLSIGRLETKKNSARTIQAFAQLRATGQYDGSLVMVGGRGHGYEAVQKTINDSPYRDDILRPGYVAAEDLPYIMNAADVFVFPSLYEGFGIPILEAFACGTPVVTSQTTSCAEVAGDAAVLVDPLDVDDIARGIVEARRGDRVARGLTRVQGYAWEQTVAQTLRLLTDQ